jgi:hypothetical protein
MQKIRFLNFALIVLTLVVFPAQAQEIAKGAAHGSVVAGAVSTAPQKTVAPLAQSTSKPIQQEPVAVQKKPSQDVDLTRKNELIEEARSGSFENEKAQLLKSLKKWGEDKPAPQNGEISPR